MCDKGREERERERERELQLDDEKRMKGASGDVSEGVERKRVGHELALALQRQRVTGSHTGHTHTPSRPGAQ